jgi:PAS domain-containing protein
MQTIGLIGYIGSGKDTVADFLTTQGFHRESFASSLKDAISAIFGWPRELLEGRTPEARAWREIPDLWWSHRLGYTVTPRWVLQYWGTEVCREGFNPDIWVASLEYRLLHANYNIVITDCRFKNEIEAIRKTGGTIWRIHRGYPETNTSHASENDWIDVQPDIFINNTGSIEDLYKEVKHALSIEKRRTG